MQITKENSKLQIWPVRHEASGRITRTTWQAAITVREDDGDDPNPEAMWCEHKQGHQTMRAAAICGHKLWRTIK